MPDFFKNNRALKTLHILLTFPHFVTLRSQALKCFNGIFYDENKCTIMKWKKNMIQGFHKFFFQLKIRKVGHVFVYS